jgi:glucosamine--fructose-6-phosphate aminotransferase (isomerizing)
MTRPTSQMHAEILEIPAAVDRLLSTGDTAIAAAAADIAARNPRFAVTVARGSSDHICTYLKYAAEILLGVPVASVGPSVASLYQAPLRLDGSLCVTVSQSGKSPDIVEMARSAGRDGALTVAITNDASSPLALASSHVLDIHAGPERSVAATKTFVASAVAGLLLLAHWKGDTALLASLSALPEALSRAVDIDWADMRQGLAGKSSLYTLGRGPSWAMSNEAALKFKEVCQIHAESYSSAEVMHGPVSIVGEGFPVIAFAAADAAESALAEAADRIAATGAQVYATTDRVRAATPLDHVRAGHPLLDPICLIASFYANVERLAIERGIDPDTPRHLRKVTETL